MKYNAEKVGMNLAVVLENKENNMTLNYYYDSSTNYSFKQEEDGYSLSLDMPGIKKTDLSLTITKQSESNILSIKAKTKDRNYNQDLKISNKLDEKSVKASLSEGVLRIKMKMKEETLNKYKIEVE
jgi:HSP20 family protein